MFKEMVMDAKKLFCFSLLGWGTGRKEQNNRARALLLLFLLYTVSC